MANERFYRQPHFENLGCSLSSGVFTIHDALGRDLSANNPAYIVLTSKANPGRMTKYKITANQSFEDATGTSDITGNLFGTTTSVAWGNNLPFGIFAVTSDDETTIEFAISRCLDIPISLSSTLNGSPASATADTDRGFWFFNDVTLTSYDNNPALMVGMIAMTKDASDDWTIAALGNQSGIGHNYFYNDYTMPTGQNGAATGGYLLANGGTAPSFTTNIYHYNYLPGGWIQCFITLSGDGGTDGSGAVSTLLVLPTSIEDHFGATNAYEGYFWISDPTNGSQMGTLECDSQNKTTFLRLADGTFVQNADFSNGSRDLRITILFRQYS